MQERYVVDLHCHTRISDGSFTAEEVIRLAKESGVTHLAITDHDTTKGLMEAHKWGSDYGVEIIPGIEISAYDHKRRRRAHILGYYIQSEHPAIESLCMSLREARHEACREAVDRIRKAGYEIDWEQVLTYAEGGTGVYKQHIMHALIDQGYTDMIYGSLYKKLFARGGNGRDPGIAYVPINYVNASRAIEAVIQAGGIPVLAHPGQMGNFEAVPEWVEAGLQGIEVRHPDHGILEEARARSLAQEFHLIMTGGSDFHGFYGDAACQIGSRNPGIMSVEQLKARRAIGS